MEDPQTESNTENILKDSKLGLSDIKIRNYGIAKTLDTGNGQVNSVAFSDDGRSMVVGCHDDTITLYDVNRAAKSLILNSKKYGVEKITFTRENNKVLYASNKVDDAIRYQSLVDNKYIRYFAGHKSPVTSLEISHSNDTFISASRDLTVRLWDLRSPDCFAVLDFNYLDQKINKTYHNPLAAIDPDNLIFVVVSTIIDQSLAELNFYDINNFQSGPFLSYNIVIHNQAEIKKIKFSPDGKYLLLLTNLQKAYICDTVVSGVVKDFTFSNSKFKKIIGKHINPLIGNFTPDGNYIYFCREDGSIKWYKTESWKDLGYKWELYNQPEMMKYPNNINKYEKSSILKEQPFIFNEAVFNNVYNLVCTASNRGLHYWLPAIEL